MISHVMIQYWNKNKDNQNPCADVFGITRTFITVNQQTKKEEEVTLLLLPNLLPLNDYKWLTIPPGARFSSVYPSRKKDG